jgi:hypothetical protein
LLALRHLVVRAEIPGFSHSTAEKKPPKKIALTREKQNHPRSANFRAYARNNPLT